MKINVKIDRISIKVEGGEEQWYTLEAAKELQLKLDDILGPVKDNEPSCGFTLDTPYGPIKIDNILSYSELKNRL